MACGVRTPCDAELRENTYTPARAAGFLLPGELRFRYLRIMRGLLLLLCSGLLYGTTFAEFQAGTAIVDITPKQLPVLVNGGMRSRSVDTINRPINARSVAFADGKETLVIVVADSCMMPRDLLDKAKHIASEKSGVPTDRILISATHTHSAPSCMGALGTNADPVYSLFLTKKLVEAILKSVKNLQPARIGWGEIDAGDYTALRRWVIRPDRIQEDPFGNFTVRANMHAATNWDNVIGPSGPEDPMLSLISVETIDGKPLSVLANFSMHYFSDEAISPDYFGLFSDGLKERISPDNDAFVAMMSHGCSGDIWRHDYEKSPDRKNNATTIEEYTSDMIDLAIVAHRDISYEVPESIKMAETRMTLAYRLPDQERLEWADRIINEMVGRPTGGLPPGGRLPQTKPEVYAREQIILNELQQTEVVVQALRIGSNIAIATTPNETYAITGLKIKNASPTPHTMVIELANGGDGYIPPPEQHLLGGYNTWPARSAGLEVEAEPKITETAIQLLETVTGQDRTDRRPGHGPAAEFVLSLKPRAYWRLDEFSGPIAVDASPNHTTAYYEPRVLFQLDGPHPDEFSEGKRNQAAHFVDDRLVAHLPGLRNDYTVSLWFWNGMPINQREDTGWIFSRGRENAPPLSAGDHVGINREGLLTYIRGRSLGKAPLENSSIERWTWNHLAYVRKGKSTYIFLNGTMLPHGFKSMEEGLPKDLDTLYFGGRCDNVDNLEGKLDEIAVFERALSSEEIKKLSLR